MAQAADQFQALVEEHQRLLPDSGSSSHSLATVGDGTIRAFLERAAAAGSDILEPRQRRELQTILRFWSAELITRGDLAQPTPKLAPPGGAKAKAQEQAANVPSGEDMPNPASWDQIRITGAARQWRERGGEGWLLKGDALRDAARFAQADDDIRKLVDASFAAEAKRGRRRWLLAGAAITILVIFTIALTASLIAAHRDRQQAELERQQAELERDRAKEAERAANQAVGRMDAILKDLGATQAEAAARARAQQQRLDQQLSALTEGARTLRHLRDAGQLGEADIPEVVRPFVKALDDEERSRANPDTSVVGPSTPVADEWLRGYDPAFLLAGAGRSANDAARRVALAPLPTPTARVKADAYREGAPLPSVNFSVVLSRSRRMPLLSATNLQRSAVIPLLRASLPFTLDPRIAADLQASPGRYGGNDIDLGHLATAREIAWGPAFATDPANAGRQAYGLVNVMTNATPQYDTFNRGLWADLEDYARERFSPGSDRVAIFSGPVFADDDVTVVDLRVPKRFWKVLVATPPDDPAGLVVEAYLVAQVDGAGRKVSGGVRLDQRLHRVRLSDIETSTGLAFDELLRAAEASTAAKFGAPALAGAQFSALLSTIVGDDTPARRPAVQQGLDLLRGGQLADNDLRALVERVVALAGAKSFATLGLGPRVNVLTLLRAVPKARWDDGSWIALKASARRAVADAAVALGCPGDTQACRLIEEIKPQLDWGLAQGRVAGILFAGMVREDVVALAGRLRTLGWSTGPEERDAAAAGFNEVRHADVEGDRRAAELLAADLRALGRSAVRAVPSSQRPGVLGVLLSI